MITANEARKLTNAKFANIHTSEGFKTLMVRIDHDIRKAIDDGDTSYELTIGLLHTMANHKLPEGVNGNVVDLAVFWWTYVKPELIKYGFTIQNTITHGHYRICW